MTHRKLQPSGDHILIKYAMASGAKSRRLASPLARRKEKASVAKVIAVGPGREAEDGTVIPLGLKVGQRVFVNRSCGIKIRLNRQSYAVIRKDDLVGKTA
jgi:chaperonin GroES